MSDSLWPYGPWPARLFCPWDVPVRNTGVDCDDLTSVSEGVFLMYPCRDVFHVHLLLRHLVLSGMHFKVNLIYVVQTDCTFFHSGLYSRLLLAICFMYSSVYVSVPFSQFISPSLSPLGVHRFVLYICLYFCFRLICIYIFFLIHTVAFWDYIQSPLLICKFPIHGFNQLWIKNIGRKIQKVPKAKPEFAAMLVT